MRAALSIATLLVAVAAACAPAYVLDATHDATVALNERSRRIIASFTPR